MKIKRWNAFGCADQLVDGAPAWAAVDFEETATGDLCDFEDVQDAIAIERFFAAVALAGTLTKIGHTMAKEICKALGENQ